jgi:hypothetical protein
MENWNGIMKLLELEHIGKDGSVLHRETDLKNIIHSQGEDLILKILFSGGALPEKYYIGLDSRSSLDKSQSMSDIFGLEPNSNAYVRQSVKSDNFSVVNVAAGYKQANSPTLLFKATGGPWGPVKNMFLTTGLGYGTTLISSVTLSTSITVADGEIITMRMAMALSSC